MRCIFCKQDSSTSVSKEHIIPESLWNTKHILDPGVVCDKCNNYFAREVEKPFLDSRMYRELRAHNEIPNKRGHIPPLNAFMAMDGKLCTAQVHASKSKEIAKIIDIPVDFIPNVIHGDRGMLLLQDPYSLEGPSDTVLSRLTAKVAIEYLATRVEKSGDFDLGFLVDDDRLDPLRSHARYNNPKTWEIHKRRIYDRCHEEKHNSLADYQTMHEFDGLVMEDGQMYFILVILGMEFAINFGGSDTSAYKEWLRNYN